ncbi:MAG: hypothetical protein H0T53_16290 [Herpetosiphonaceae bacterium]|nr:hypothetical protein [Herpetosiphonaceae bacterium]
MVDTNLFKWPQYQPDIIVRFNPARAGLARRTFVPKKDLSTSTIMLVTGTWGGFFHPHAAALSTFLPSTGSLGMSQ